MSILIYSEKKSIYLKSKNDRSRAKNKPNPMKKLLNLKKTIISPLMQRKMALKRTKLEAKAPTNSTLTLLQNLRRQQIKLKKMIIPFQNSLSLIVLKNICSVARLKRGSTYQMTANTMLKTIEVKVRAKFNSLISAFVAHLSKQ